MSITKSIIFQILKTDINCREDKIDMDVYPPRLTYTATYSDTKKAICPFICSVVIKGTSLLVSRSEAVFNITAMKPPSKTGNVLLRFNLIISYL